MTQGSIFILVVCIASAWFAPTVRAQTTQLCDPFGTVPVPNASSREYVVQNNFWNQGAAGGTQCITVNGASGAFTITSAAGPVATNGAPASYPSIFKGCHWGNCTNGSGLPLQVSNLGSADVYWAITPKSSGQWNAALDLWFHQSATTSGQPNGAEMMIWLNHRGAPQPVGSVVARNVSIAGTLWDVWFGNSGWNVISYVRVTPASTLGEPTRPISLKPFIADAQARSYLQASWWLIAAEAGFEPWEDGLNLASNAFTASFTPGTSNPPGSHVLTVTRSGTGGGAVSSTPPGIACGNDCSESFPSGTSVTLTAAPSGGAVFAGWSGACGGTGTTCTVSMTQARSVGATFQSSGGACTVTTTPLVIQNQPWYSELGVRIDSTATIQALAVTITLRRTAGLNYSGQYNTVGATQSHSSSSAALTYTFSLGSGQLLGPGTDRRFVAQASGTGTVHPTSSDSYSVTSTCGGTTRTSTGTF